MSIPKLREDRLPLWARHRLKKLEADVEHYKQIAETLAKGEHLSPIYFGNAFGSKVYLPATENYTFELGDRHDICARIAYRNKRATLEVIAYHSDQLAFFPSSANAGYLVGIDS